jgi:hypothetical protein
MTFGPFLSNFGLQQHFAPTITSGRRAPLTLPFSWLVSVCALGNLSILCASVVERLREIFTTETQRANRLHKEQLITLLPFSTRRTHECKDCLEVCL